jgi:uncharacterized OsmC-like protein
MSRMIVRSTSKSTGTGLSVESKSRKFKLTIDEPKVAGGNDEGMNPMEVFLSALGGCQIITAMAFAKKKGIDIQDIWVDTEGDLDPAGFMGDPSVRPGFSQIRLKFHIKSSSPADKIEEFVDFVEKTCPVSDSIRNGVELVKNEVDIEPTTKPCCSSCCANKN